MTHTLSLNRTDVSQPEAELRRRNRELAALDAVAVAVSQSLDLAATLDAALEQTLEVLNAEGGLIYLFDPTSETLTPAAQRGLSPAMLRELTGAKLGQGLSGQAALTGQPIIVPHLAADARNVSPTAVREGWQALATVPLYAKGKLVGVLTAESRILAHFTADSLELLTAIGHQVGAAIENARLFQEIQHLKAFNESVVQGVAEAILIEDRAGVLTFANPAAERLLGYAAEALVGQPWTAIVPQAQRTKVRAESEKRPLGVATQYEAALCGKDGRVIPVIVNARPLFSDGQFTGVVSAFTDITERVRAEDALARRADELAALHATVVEVSSQPNLDALLHTIVERAVRLLAARGGELHLCDPERRETRCVVSYNTPKDYTGMVMQYGEGAAGLVAQTGEPLVVTDYHAWSNRVIACDNDPLLTAILGVPMVWRGAVIGVLLALDRTEVRFFSPANQELLAMFASQAAIAVANARLLEAEREQRAQAEALRDTAATLASALNLNAVLDRVLAEVGRVTPHDAAFIMLIEGEVARVARSCGFAERGLAEALATMYMAIGEVADLRMMAETGQPVIVSDTQTYPGWVIFPATQWARSHVGAPLRAKGRLLGFLNLYSATPGFFSRTRADHVKAFADQVAVAVENAQLFEAERAQRAQAEALADTAAVLASALSFDVVLGHILAQADRVVPHDAATIMLVEHGHARVVRSRGFVERGLPDPAPQVQFLLAETPNLNSIVTTGRPEVIADTHRYAAWVDLPETHWIGSHIGVPISSQGQVIGILNLDSVTPGFFTAAHAELLQAFADQAAVAVERAQLFETLEERVVARTAALAQREAELQAVNTRLADLERLKSQFLANASHELRTPLTNIKAYLDLLTRGRPEKRDRYMTILKREADILHLLVENLLDVAQLDFGRARPKLIAVDLNQLLVALQDVCNLLVADRALQLRFDLAPDLPPVLADLRMLRQVITSLVSYATDQSPGGEALVLQTQSQRAGEGVWITLSVTGKWLSVAPAGPHATGVSRSQMIMPGGGLRLVICQEIVTTLGGKLTTASLPDDRGSLTVWLPTS